MTEFVITGSTPIQFVALPIAAAGQNPATLSNGLNSNIATGGQPTVRLSGPSAAFSGPPRFADAQGAKRPQGNPTPLPRVASLVAVARSNPGPAAP